MTMPK